MISSFGSPAGSRRFLLGATFAAVLAAAGSSPAGAAPAAAKPAAPRKVVLLGLDGADWTLLDPFLAKGIMPNLARVIREGRTANLKSEVPLLSPVLWTTIATGAHPADHGVLDFEEFEPSDGSRGPVSARSREFPALWSTASAKGLDVGLAGWWASWPCEKLRGYCIADRFAPTLFDAPPVTAGMIHPEVQAKSMERIRTDEIAKAKGDLRRVFGVDEAAARALGPVGPKTVEGLTRVLAQSRIFVRTGLALGERVHPSLLALYVAGTDEVGHVAAKWHPPRLPGVDEREFAVFSRAVEGFYREADRLIGEVADYARREGAVLVAVSDHGFRWGSDRPALTDADAWNTAAYWHRIDGVLIVSGPGVAPAAARAAASIYDVAPTVSALLGLPVDARMKGKVLSAWFAPPPPRPKAADLRATIPVALMDVGRTSEATRRDAAARREELRALGYLTGGERPSGAPSPGGRPGRTEGGWNNLGLLERDRGRPREAEAAFRKALEINPGYASPLSNLSFLLSKQGRHAEADEAVIASVEKGNPRAEGLLAARIADLSKKGVPKDRLAKFLEAAARRLPGSRTVALAEGRRRYEAKQCREAAEVFDRYTAAKGDDPEILNYAGVARLCLGDPEGAIDRFRRSLRKDPNQRLPREALRELGAL